MFFQHFPTSWQNKNTSKWHVPPSPGHQLTSERGPHSPQHTHKLANQHCKICWSRIHNGIWWQRSQCIQCLKHKCHCVKASNFERLVGQGCKSIPHTTCTYCPQQQHQYSPRTQTTNQISTWPPTTHQSHPQRLQIEDPIRIGLVPARGGRISKETNMDSGNKTQAVCIMAGTHRQSRCQAPLWEQRDNEGTWAERAERTTFHEN